MAAESCHAPLLEEQLPSWTITSKANVTKNPRNNVISKFRDRGVCGGMIHVLIKSMAGSSAEYKVFYCLVKIRRLSLASDQYL